jgi:hypothetical protein
VTRVSRSLSWQISTPVRRQLEVRLDVPNLGQAVVFYSNIFNARPMAVERRMVWFEVPDSTLSIELREAVTPSATQLRLCTEPRHLQRIAARLTRSGVAIAQAGVTREGRPRAISFHDPGHNCWELYEPIVASSSPASVHARIARPWRSLTRHVQAAWSASASFEERFNQQRAHDEALLHRYR